MISPTLIIAAVGASFAFAGGFGLAWKLQAGNIATIESEAKDERLAQQRAAHLLKERNLETVIKAQNAASGRVAVLRRESALAASAHDRLRTSSDNALRAANADAATCNRVVAAYGVVFAEAVGELQTLANDAGQCGSAYQLTQEAWPR